MKFRPAIGESDFRKIRDAGLGYIDKTDFIRQVLDDSISVLLFPRPRRFGKTINISTLGYFLRKTDEDLSHLFEGLAVTRDAQAMTHFQKYPVVSITFKEVKEKTFQEALESIHTQIVKMYDEHRYLLDSQVLSERKLSDIRRILYGEPTKIALQNSLYLLSAALYEHHKKGVVILIDEYDTPIQSGYMYDFFDDIVLFFRNFFSAAFKDNVALFKGVLTGILRVSKENMFSGLNNIKVHSILSPHYATSFGFTENEVASIIEPAQLEAVRAWYNGYIFGGQVIYNPWSILNYVYERLLLPYWVNTGSTDLLETLALKQGLGLSFKSEALLQGESIEMPIDSNIVLRDIDKSPNALWNFLLFSGYLKTVELKMEVGEYSAKLAIPNLEVKTVYRTMFRNWLHRADPKWVCTDALVNGLLAGDSPTVQENLGRILQTAMSYQDPAGAEPEKLYHGFILGLLVHLETHYDVRSNRESGDGRVDVFMRPKTSGRPGVVMEFKVVGRGETVDHALKEAAKQIRERKYATELAAGGVSPVHEYAMVFDGKRAYVKLADETLTNNVVHAPARKRAKGRKRKA